MHVPIDRADLSSAQRDVLRQALTSYATKCERRGRNAARSSVQSEARWRAFVARELLAMCE